MNLFSELRRRNVFRVALFYLVAAWLVVQVAETVLPLFEVPDAVLRGLVMLLALGFLPALAFSWIYELTPEGMKRETDVRVSPETRRRTAIRLDLATLVVALLSIGLIVMDRMVPGRAEAPLSDAQSHLVTQLEEATFDGNGETASIAVLPFVNMSPQAENEYFADGISEEILNLLSGAPQLQVVGRTSSFRFKNHEEDLRSIGQQLGVAYIVEGSVRRDGERVRITAQLVQASDGVRLWGASWDRELTNVFAVQDEIGREVTAALRQRLTTDVATPDPRPTTAPEPYTLYLRGRALLAERGADNMHQAVELLEQSIALDPEYAPAHAALAQSLSLLPLYDRSDPDARPGWIERAIDEAERAIELDPELAQAWSALGSAQAFHRWDWPAAIRAFDRALELAPTDAEILNLAGDFHRITRNVGRALALEGQALRLDPLRAFNHSDLAHAHHLAGDCEAALDWARSGHALDPGMPYAHLELVLCNGALGDLDAMREAVEQARAELQPQLFRFLMLDFWLALADGRSEDARRFLVAISQASPEEGYSPGRIGFGWLLLGESERALKWLEIAYATRDWSLVVSEPIDLDLIDADPVARAVLKHSELSELQQFRSIANPVRSSSQPGA